MSARFDELAALTTVASGRARTATLLALHVATAIALRAFSLVRYRIDSDEPQHLHVVWQWTQGLLPYRDFYDNHMPLFHLLFAPLLQAAGESERVLLLGRLAMLPLVVASVALTWYIAHRLS